MKIKSNKYAAALQRLQAAYPNDWQKFIPKAVQNIKAAIRKHKLEFTDEGIHEAISLCLTISDAAVTITEYYAAGAIMKTLADLEEEHVSIETRSMRIEDQLKKVEKSTTMTGADKRLMIDYYTRAQDKVSTITDRIIAELLELGKALKVSAPEDAPAISNRPFGHLGNRGSAMAV